MAAANLRLAFGFLLLGEIVMLVAPRLLALV
jgi:hypothetical protein